MPGSFGYFSNRGVRTRSNGRRASHGYNYRLLIQHCAKINREREERRRGPARMFSTAAEAFREYRKRRGKQ